MRGMGEGMRARVFTYVFRRVSASGGQSERITWARSKRIDCTAPMKTVSIIEAFTEASPRNDTEYPIPRV